MCDTGNQGEVPPAEALPASVEWKGEVLPLEPVDELSVPTSMIINGNSGAAGPPTSAGKPAAHPD